MSRSRHSALFALITAAALTLTGCADPAEPGAGTAKGEAKGKTPTTDVVSSVKQGQAETAEMGHPLGPQTFGEPMGTGPHDSEHDDPPRAVPAGARRSHT
ncbi:hypothetical protein SMICM17S_11926 [Streptomyces microflavus]